MFSASVFEHIKYSSWKMISTTHSYILARNKPYRCFAPIRVSLNMGRAVVGIWVLASKTYVGVWEVLKGWRLDLTMVSGDGRAGGGGGSGGV